MLECLQILANSWCLRVPIMLKIISAWSIKAYKVGSDQIKVDLVSVMYIQLVSM